MTPVRGGQAGREEMGSGWLQGRCGLPESLPALCKAGPLTHDLFPLVFRCMSQLVILYADENLDVLKAL